MKKSIRVVIDTNVLISSFWGKKPGEIIALWSAGKLTAVISPEILNEYMEVMQRFNLSEDNMEAVMEVLSDTAHNIYVSPHEKVNVVKKDSSDNKFIECALAGKAGFIISGDKHLKNIGEYKGIKILTPAEFLDNIS
ncbi:MAG: putative toxin-antitoxin system toxin component, PIN family [Candidatus Goldbacteria bacterium]|nr:putative toxin-antitoxin system toxin component, PIN family [Candidatus Goldiibacteriota bacterium]